MLHPSVEAKRNLLDMAKEEFLKRCELDPNGDLEQSLEISGFKLKILFANVPFPDRYETIVDDYEERIDKKEIEDYALIPAWWVPALMNRIVEKELLPFAIYVK